MIKAIINNEEVVSNKDLTISEELLKTSSTILNNCYPKTWEQTHDYISNFYFPKDYSKCCLYNETIITPITGQTVNGTNFTIDYDDTLNFRLEKIEGDTFQNSSPNPNYPQPINTVTGRQEITICGKNLFDGTIVQGVVGNTGVNNISNRIRNTKFINVIPGQTYSLSFETTNGINQYNISYFTSASFPRTSETGWINTSFTIPSGINYIMISLSKSSGQNIVPTDISNVQLEQNSQATEYEPYSSDTYEINLGKNLFDKDNIISGYTINNSGGFTVDSNSNMYWVKVNEGETYTLSSGTSIRQWVYNFFATQPDTNSVGTSRTVNNSINETFTVPNGYNYICVREYITTGETIINLQLEQGSQATSYSPYKTPIELCKIGDYQDYIYKDNDKWYLHKEIKKLVLNGSENFTLGGTGNTEEKRFNLAVPDVLRAINSCISTHFKNNGDTYSHEGISGATSSDGRICIRDNSFNNSITDFKTWLETHNTEVYYILATPTNTEITDEELISQLNSVALINGINNVNVISPNLSGSIQIYYNYRIGETIDDLIFCGLVKNTGNISLNPREPHYADLQVLDFKTLLSEGKTLDFVISNQTIGQAIERVIEEISSYGFVLGEIDIDAENDIIGAYSTLNKTPYDVFQYLADISQSKWFTRVIDENTIAIDFYDSDKLPVADNIEYTQEYFKQNNIVDISFSFNSNDYRNKQIILSQQVYGNVDVIDDVISNGYNTSFTTTQIIGNVTNITVDGVAKTFITNAEKNIGLTADFYYTPNSDKFESDSPYTAGSQITIEYTPLIKGRRIVNNNVEINRINEQIDRNGTISRYEERNDILDGDELTKVAETYIKYKGEKEITLNITTLNNDLFNIGEQVYFDMPYVNDLSTTYLVKKKDIQITQIGESGNVFYEYSLSSNFNSESDINYFDNQRRKAEGNITEDNFITRNIDIQDSANIIFDNLNIVEITMTGDNVLNSPLNSPFNN